MITLGERHRHERKRTTTNAFKRTDSSGSKKRLTRSYSTCPHGILLRAIANVLDSHLRVVIYIRIFDLPVLLLLGTAEGRHPVLVRPTHNGYYPYLRGNHSAIVCYG